MATALQIVHYPDPILLQKTPSITEIDGALQEKVDGMIDLLAQSNGLGLAGTQVGEALRLFVYDLSAREADPTARTGAMVILNPEIVAQEGEEIAEEGCLSIPGYFERVKRAFRVQLRGIDREGHAISLEAEGLAARLFQHEVDHLNGVMMIDHFSSLKRQLFLRKFKKMQEEAVK